MIYTIILNVEAFIVVVLAVIAAIVIRRNNRLERDKQSLQRAVADAQHRAAEWLEEATRLAQENAALNARNTALVEAMQARPTQPKRTVRKTSTTGEQQ